VAGEKILIVDDEPGVRTALANVLSDEGYRVTAVESAESGLAALEGEEFDGILLDVWLPGMDGLEALKRIGELPTDAEVVMISGHGNIETAVRATKLGAFDFVEKPLSLEKTLLVLRNALQRRRLERRNRQLMQQLARHVEIIGGSAPALRLREQAEVAAATDAPVLLCGEPGSGRETVARRIHSAGPRAEGAFVEVACGALDPATAEATLFGANAEPGRLRMAAEGSLFLEDVERLAPELQRKLASYLDQDPGERRPLRVLASTGVDPAELHASLRHRLEVIRIAVPALRQRRDDVPLLAERFISDLAREYGRRPKQLSPDCLLALKTYDWPGNVAELRNLMERLLLFTDGDVVEVADLPESLGGARSAVEDLYREFPSLDQGLLAFERYYIARIFAEENSDTEAAARRLGMTSAELARRLARIRS
jgi:two-component system nitrogen regulation response regulator NtrX